MTVGQVGIVGGGLMGAGIAEVAATAGITVTVRDVSPTALVLARERARRSLMVASSGVSGPKQMPRLRSAGLATDLGALREADLVIEAMPEDAHLKSSVLRDLSVVVSPTALVASSTSSIPIAELAAAVPEPGRVMGLHFFSPVPVMGLVEVVAALETAPDAVAAGKRFARQSAKHRSRRKTAQASS